MQKKRHKMLKDVRAKTKNARGKTNRPERLV
jgi:hypothetical protein